MVLRSPNSRSAVAPKTGDLLVLNNTKVIPTRLRGLRGAARIEVTLHKQQSADQWLAFARPGRRLKVGDEIRFDNQFLAESSKNAKAAKLSCGLQRRYRAPSTPYASAAKCPCPLHSASRWRNEERPSFLSDDLRRSGRSGRGSDSGIAFHGRTLRCARPSRNQSNVCDPACRCGHISTDQERCGRGSPNARRDGYFNQRNGRPR